ncbi:hypothetical protein JCM8547_007822 [Rhodosporidiobolus lusitaniae]
MASSSPPPPPDPTRSDPFRTHCGASSSSPSRPSLRRAKTLANPESPTRWRREVLADVTNAVLGVEYGGLGRLQRVPIDADRLPPQPNDDGLPSSPSTPSRIPRRALRRTRSAAPSIPGAEPSFSSPSTSTSTGPAPSALPSDGLASPSRELRPRIPRPVAAAPAATSHRRNRLRSTSLGGGARSASAATARTLAPPSSSLLGSPTPGPSRRRTFGGLDVTLSAVLEDPAGESSSLAPTPTPTPRTRSRMRDLADEDEGEEASERDSPSENSERRLRRRRSSGGGSTSGLRPGTPTGRESGSGGRRGLR